MKAQFVGDPHLVRSGADHIWTPHDGAFVCVLCGAVAEFDPRQRPPLPGWLPKRYLKLTDELRALSPRT